MTRRQLVVVALLLAAFAGYASYRAPVPGVNEPHYLCKARHFWDRGWCARDLFLASADAHFVFYATVGALARWLSFEQTAWIGRLTVWGGLAVAWMQLAGRLHARWLSPLWSAAMFLALQASLSFSGEWLVGGVEAKGFAYVALLAAIALACRGSWRAAAAACGAGVSFHPVVGMWGTLALVPAVAWGSLPDFRAGAGRFDFGKQFDFWRSRAIEGSIWLAFAAPGLFPAARLVLDRPPPEISSRADRIQVFERLKHHLDPREFPQKSYIAYGVMLGGWLIARPFMQRNDAERLFARFVLATLAIAAVGLAVGLGPRWPGVMKFYPFRLFDVFLPLALATAVVNLLERAAGAPWSRKGGRSLARMLAPAAGCAALAWALSAPGRYTNAANWKKPGNWEAFVEACRWIDQNTPREALFLTPRQNVGFKWYAERAELVTWKDCPQDAVGIVEWKDRLELVARWRSQHFRGGFSEAALASLARRTGIGYVLAWNVDPWRIEPIYRNEGFSVYAVAK